MDEAESRNSYPSPKKAQVRKVKNVGLSYIVLTVILTSCTWVLLDIYLIHAAGFHRTQRADSPGKLPLDNREDLRLQDLPEGHLQGHPQGHIEGDPRGRIGGDPQGPIEGHAEVRELGHDELLQDHGDGLGAQVEIPNRKFEKAVLKMKEMARNEVNLEANQEANQDKPRHFTGPLDIQAANVAAAKHRLAADLRENDRVRQFNQQPMQPQIRPLEHHGEDSLLWEQVRNVDVTLRPRDPDGPGEGGKGVVQLNEEREEVQREWAKAEFNLFLNSKMSFERSIPDVRPPSCRGLKYPYKALPKTSIIICFTDEAWPTLLRSVHSVLNRSPAELVEEVILVDDFSQADHLKQPLENYIARFPKVKLLRLPSRQGLIRARLAGVGIAKGPVLTFLDSHIEATIGWLEPLLERIRQNRTNVVTPVIDSIDAQSMRYSSASNTLRGGFTWVALQFRWRGSPAAVLDARHSDADPVPSPTMAGGLFSIDKEFFLKLGTYDPGLDIWGAENLELSFKSWMCGGRLEILPCSHVGHIFRARQPYKFPSGDNVRTFLRNTLRVVNVWLDDYKKVFYAVNPDMLKTDFGDVSDRLQLRQQLGCHSFDWYVKNVYTNLEIPPADIIASGSVVNKNWNMCLDKVGGRESVGVYPCHGQGGNQAFRLTRDGRLASSEHCFTGGRKANSAPIIETSCSNQRVIRWHHTRGGVLRNIETGLCLGVASDKKLVMMPCFNQGPHLQWTFTNYFP